MVYDHVENFMPLHSHKHFVVLQAGFVMQASGVSDFIT